ncbi:MAG: hypothetical protein KC729_04725, partial [Candidatus Eisenbacteria bacterium]|nr:hypothetical protein [Candidatus Eisenbacteria bacterium]
MIRRLLAIVAGAFACVSAAVDAEDPADHASLWSAFTSAVALLVVHASVVELTGDRRIVAPTLWLVLVFVLGLVALVSSGTR